VDDNYNADNEATKEVTCDDEAAKEATCDQVSPTKLVDEVEAYDIKDKPTNGAAETNINSVHTDFVEWLEHPVLDSDDYDCLIAADEAYLVAKTEKSLNEEQSKENQFGFYYNTNKLFEYAGK